LLYTYAPRCGAPQPAAQPLMHPPCARRPGRVHGATGGRGSRARGPAAGALLGRARARAAAARAPGAAQSGVCRAAARWRVRPAARRDGAAPTAPAAGGRWCALRPHLTSTQACARFPCCRQALRTASSEAAVRLHKRLGVRAGATCRPPGHRARQLAALTLQYSAEQAPAWAARKHAALKPAVDQLPGQTLRG